MATGHYITLQCQTPSRPPSAPLCLRLLLFSQLTILCPPVRVARAVHSSSHGRAEGCSSEHHCGARGGGHGGGGGERCWKSVQPRRPVPLRQGHPGSSSSGAQSGVLPCGEERGQELHVQPAEVGLIPRPDGAQRTPAAEEVRSHRSARLSLRT
jgi:hypothetical protein